MTAGSQTARIRIRNGLDLPLSGRPEQRIHPGQEGTHVALCGPDYPGLKPRLLVTEGEEVAFGQALFIDKRDPSVPYCSPGQGVVAAINRGARRALESVVVRLTGAEPEHAAFDAAHEADFARLKVDGIAGRLQESGLWTAFCTRPFSRVPMSDALPGALFVTAIDTRPLAADPLVVLRKSAGAFAAGLRILSRLSRRDVFLCVAPDWDIELPPIDRVRQVEFAGPHPAGLPGTHIHHLYPVAANRSAWHIGYQDVIAIGRLFRDGTIDNRRVVALGGSSIGSARLVSTRLGVSTAELTAGEIRNEEEARVISGCVLDGRTAAGGLSFLGRYHEQVSVLREGGDRQLFGWAGLFPRRYSASRTFLKKSGHRGTIDISTSQNGRFSGMLPIRAFEKVLPLDILPSPLFRALLVRDTDRAQALGCLELAEEDLALCTFLCPAKNDYGAALRINLEQIEREG